MTNEEIIEQLENAIGIIKQDGRDWLDDRDIPILEACIKSLTTLDKIRAEILRISSYKGFELGGVKDGYRIAMVNVLNIIDKYKAETEDT